MAERQKITTLSVITDSETSYDNIGDIDGGMFENEWLRRHLKNHGSTGLINHLAHMMKNILNVEQQVWEEGQQAPEANIKTNTPC